MPELDEVLDAVRREVSPLLRPPGANAAMTTVRRRRRTRALVAATVTAALLLVPFGLSRASHEPPAGTPTDVWREFVACARSHGQPGWPDPTVAPDGHATFPDFFEVKKGLPAVETACGSILDRLPVAARPPKSR